jgi:chromosome segregation ATPase
LQVSKLKQDVMRIKSENARKTKQGNADGRGALEQVTNLQSALDDAKGGQEQLKMQARNAEMQREAAARKEAQLTKDMAAVLHKLSEAEEETTTLRQQVRSIRGSTSQPSFAHLHLHMQTTKGVHYHVMTSAGACVQIAETNSALDDERHQHEQAKMKAHSADLQREAAGRREAELRSDISSVRLKLESAEAELALLREQLQSAKGAQSESGKGLVSLQARLEEATAEKQRLAAKLSVLEDDRRSLQEQLQDVRFRMQGHHSRARDHARNCDALSACCLWCYSVLNTEPVRCAGCTQPHKRADSAVQL